METQSTKLYVGNLPWSFDDARLREIFAEYGQISHCKVIYDRSSPPRSRGFGFVEFVEEADADAALTGVSSKELTFEGRQMEVDKAKADPRVKRGEAASSRRTSSGSRRRSSPSRVVRSPSRGNSRTSPPSRGKSPPSRGRSPPPSRGRSPPPSRGRNPPVSRGRSPLPPSSRGRNPPVSRGRSPPPSSRGRSPPPSRGRSPLKSGRASRGVSPQPSSYYLDAPPPPPPSRGSTRYASPTRQGDDYVYASRPRDTYASVTKSSYRGDYARDPPLSKSSSSRDYPRDSYAPTSVPLSRDYAPTSSSRYSSRPSYSESSSYSAVPSSRQRSRASPYDRPSEMPSRRY